MVVLYLLIIPLVYIILYIQSEFSKINALVRRLVERDVDTFRGFDVFVVISYSSLRNL
jgi:hypothetical protein